MPTHLKALIVILVLATAVFAFAKAPACALASTPEDFERRRNLWFGITLTVFLAHNFWIYIIVVATLLFIAVPREPNKLALFFFVLFAVPPTAEKITGLGIIQHFFEIGYIRLLALTVLLPAFWSLRKQPDVVPFGRSLPDKLIAGYIILNFGLLLTVSSITNTLRFGAFYAFIDIFLPYYVASRSMKRRQDFRDALMAFVVAALVLSAIGAFEAVRHWLLYASLDEALGSYGGYGGYLEREETGLRAQGSTGHSIVLGYVIAVAFGLFFYLRKSVANAKVWGLGLGALLVGLISALSRGPWVGAAAILLVFVATGPSPVKRLTQFGLVGVLVFAVLLATPLGDKIIALLPFVGTIEQENVSYRQRLLEIGIGVIQQNPFFGDYGFFLAPEAQELKQGNGMIDLGNTYLAIGLGNGLIGLSLFSGFFIAIAIGILKGMRKSADRNSELYLLGQVLLSVLIGILVIIFTASSILFIPVIYWSVAGLGVAYARLLALEKSPVQDPVKAPVTAQPVNFQPTTMRNR